MTDTLKQYYLTNQHL